MGADEGQQDTMATVSACLVCAVMVMGSEGRGDIPPTMCSDHTEALQIKLGQYMTTRRGPAGHHQRVRDRRRSGAPYLHGIIIALHNRVEIDVTLGVGQGWLARCVQVTRNWC